MQRVVQDYRGNEQIHARVIRRPELPYELVEQLIGVMGERLEWQLIRERRMPAEEARALMNAVRERATISFTARAHADGKLQQHLLAEFSAGQLVARAAAALPARRRRSPASRSAWPCTPGWSPTMCRRLLYHADRRHLAALCLAAGLATPHYLTLRMALEIAEEAMAPRVRRTAATAPTRSASCRRSTTSSAATRPSCGCCWATDADRTATTGARPDPPAHVPAGAARLQRPRAGVRQAPCPQRQSPQLSTRLSTASGAVPLHSARQRVLQAPPCTPGGAGPLGVRRSTRPSASSRTTSRPSRRCWAPSWSTTTPITGSASFCGRSISSSRCTPGSSSAARADRRAASSPTR